MSASPPVSTHIYKREKCVCDKNVPKEKPVCRDLKKCIKSASERGSEGLRECVCVCVCVCVRGRGRDSAGGKVKKDKVKAE